MKSFFKCQALDCSSRADLIESMAPCHDAQVVGFFQVSNPFPLTVLAAMSEDYNVVPQHVCHKTDHGQIVEKLWMILVTVYPDSPAQTYFTLSESWTQL